MMEDRIKVAVPTDIKIKKASFKIFVVLFLAVILILTYLPILVMGLTSFSTHPSGYDMPGVTTKWYGMLFTNRELFNSIYMIRDKCDFEEFKRIKSVINIIDTCNEKIHRIKTKIKRLLHIPLKSDKRSMYKNVKRFLLQRMDKLNSKDFLVYTVDIYDTTKEAENNSKNRFTTKLVLPKKWCYGPIDTYEYSYQYDATVAVSEVSPEQKKQDEFIEEKIELANEMLKKKVVEKKKKEKDDEDKETSYKEEKIVIGGC